MPKAGEPCGMYSGHTGKCRTAESIAGWRARGNEARRLTLTERYAAINDYKMQHGCEVCGYRKDPVALDLDHKNPADKVDDISNLVRYAPWLELLAELAKCRVLCANCHRIKTHRSPPPGTAQDDGLSA